MSSLTEFLASYYRLRPVNATFTGVHEHDRRLPDWSPDGLAAAADEMQRVRPVCQRPARKEPQQRRRERIWIRAGT